MNGNKKTKSNLMLLSQNYSQTDNNERLNIIWSITN